MATVQQRIQHLFICTAPAGGQDMYIHIGSRRSGRITITIIHSGNNISCCEELSLRFPWHKVRVLEIEMDCLKSKRRNLIYWSQSVDNNLIGGSSTI